MTNGDIRARFTLRLPANLLEDLGKEAAIYGTSINALILRILGDWSKARD